MTTTITTGLAICLQEAGYACPACAGYGTHITPEDALNKTVSPCPECKGSRLNAEQRAIETDNARIERCESCGEALDVAPQEPVCHRCRSENATDFSYAPEAP